MAEGNTSLPIHGDNHTLIRLHEERMGRNERRLENVAASVDECKNTTDAAINALRLEFVDELKELRDEIRRRPKEVIAYIVVGALLVLGGDTVRALAEKIL